MPKLYHASARVKVPGTGLADFKLTPYLHFAGLGLPRMSFNFWA
jgi:hypothetical protein